MSLSHLKRPVRIELVPLSPNYHAYVWKRIVHGSEAWKASEVYREAVGRDRISVWELNPKKFTVKVALREKWPIGFYALEHYSFEPIYGEWRYFLEEIHSEHAEAMRMMWVDIGRRIREDPNGIRKLYAYVLSENDLMKELSEKKGFKKERYQISKEF